MLTEDELVAAQHEELRALQWESIPANRAAAELATERKLEEGLLWAAKAGNVEVATTLIKAGASVSARCRLNCTPVYIASQFGHTEMARLLIRTVRTAAAPWGMVVAEARRPGLPQLSKAICDDLSVSEVVSEREL